MEDQKLADEMEAEENFIDPGEEDDDYDPDDEDSIDSEEEATSADEEYTPTRGTTPIPARTTPTTKAKGELIPTAIGALDTRPPFAPDPGADHVRPPRFIGPPIRGSLGRPHSPIGP